MKPINQLTFNQILILFGLIFASLTAIICTPPEIIIPHLALIKPARQSAGQQIQISGMYLKFGTRVVIGAERLTFSMTDEKAIVNIPKDMIPGAYELFMESVEGESNKLQIQILPKGIGIKIKNPDNVPVDTSLIIEADYLGDTTKVVFCKGTNDEVIIENALKVLDTTLSVTIPKSIWYDRDTKDCSLEIESDGILSISLNISIINNKNPKITTPSLTNVLAKDEITIEGNNLNEDGLTVEIDGIPTTSFIPIESTGLAIILPETVKKEGETGEIKVKTNYGEEIINYSPDDIARRLPKIDLDLTSEIVYRDDSIILIGNNFSEYPLQQVILTPDDGSAMAIDPSNYTIINNSLMMLDYQRNIEGGTILLKNVYGDTQLFQFQVLNPPRIQLILPKSNPVNGPMYIYGQDLLNVDLLIFKNELKNIELKLAEGQFQRHSRCFDLQKDTCDIITLNVPVLLDGNYDIYVSILEGAVEKKRSRDPFNFEVVKNYDPTSLASFGNTNIVLPIPPPAAAVNDVGNKWIISNNHTLYQLIQNDFSPTNNYFDIQDEIGNTIGRYRQDGTHIELNLNGDQFFGQFDEQYYDKDDENFWVKKMVLIPQDQGKVLILYNRTSVIDSLSNYKPKAGEAVTIYGYFQSTQYALYYNNAKTALVTPTANSTIKYYVPQAIAPGTYTIYLEDQFGDFTISNRKSIQISP